VTFGCLSGMKTWSKILVKCFQADVSAMGRGKGSTCSKLVVFQPGHCNGRVC
jgi:hypothetical protein